MVYNFSRLLHFNAYAEKTTLAADTVPFLLSKRKMMERYEESRKRVVDMAGNSLMKILTKEAKQSLSSSHLKLDNIDMYVGQLPAADRQLLVPPINLAQPDHMDLISIVRSCGQSETIRNDLFNTLMNASYNSDRVIRVSAAYAVQSIPHLKHFT